MLKIERPRNVQPREIALAPNRRWADQMLWLYNGASPLAMWGPEYGSGEIIGAAQGLGVGSRGVYNNTNVSGGVKFTPRSPGERRFSQLREFTLLGLMRRGTASQYQGLVWGSSRLMRFNSGGGPYWRAAVGVTGSYEHELNLNSADEHVLLVLTTGIGTLNQPIFGYVNGQYVGTNNNVSAAGWESSDVSPVWIGPAQNGSLGTAAGWPYLAAGWARRLSGAEIAQIAANPWQLFAPRRIWVPQAGITGLPTLSASTYKPGTLTSSGWTARITAS